MLTISQWKQEGKGVVKERIGLLSHDNWAAVGRWMGVVASSQPIILFRTYTVGTGSYHISSADSWA